MSKCLLPASDLVSFFFPLHYQLRNPTSFHDSPMPYMAMEIKQHVDNTQQWNIYIYIYILRL